MSAAMDAQATVAIAYNSHYVQHSCGLSAVREKACATVASEAFPTSA
jgi:hypothetical protein